MDLTDKMEKNNDRSNAVSVVVTIDEDVLLSIDGTNNEVDSLLHILHQERIVEITQGRGEKPAGIIKAVNITTHENPRHDRAKAQFLDKKRFFFVITFPHMPASCGQFSCRHYYSPFSSNPYLMVVS